MTSSGCRWGWWLALGGIVALAGVAVFRDAPSAEAHAFLVRTTPAQGERLDAAPRDIALEFSEAFDERSARLELTVEDQPEPLIPEVGTEGRVLRSDLAARQDGVYVVSWDVIAEDGHQTAGEFAFAVGDTAGDIPVARNALSPPSAIRVAAGILFFAGLALAAGGLAAAWTKASTFRPGVLRAGLGLGLAGALVAWVAALVADEPARQEMLLAATAAALAGAMLLAPLAPTRRWPVTVAVAGAAAAWSARGHSAIINGLAAGVIDVVHLLAGATWVGALVLLVADLRRERRETGVLTVARRYARLAAVLVAVLTTAGTTSAVLLLDRPADLWTTGYGRTLAAKVSLVVIALVLATLGRRALARRRPGRLRRVTPLEAGALAGVLGITALLINLGPPAATTAAGASVLGPAPITGPVVRDAGLAGNLTVTATAGSGQLRIEVFAPSGRPATDAHVDLDAELPDGERPTLLPRPCGPGCFTQRIQLPAGTTRLSITASDPDRASGLHVAELDAPPPPSEPALLAELTSRMRSVPAVEFTETTTSGPGSVVTPMTFTLPGDEFVDLEPWAAGTADDIQPLGGGTGFRMYLPGDRIWITVWQDDQGRIARERIVSMGHEIERDNFSYPTP